MLLGHTALVHSVAFSPDGTRLASASSDQTVRIWDVTTGQELLTLRYAPGRVRSVAFSPDGTQLAASGFGSTPVIWDARPWTPEAALEREALGLLDFLFTRPLRKVDVLEYLRSSPTVRPEARQKALALMDRYREETDPTRYRQASWALVRQPYLNAFQYGFAFQQAQGACQLAPEEATYQHALGMAHYRLGRYQEALATLTQADRRTTGSPAVLAFLAMTHHQLAQKEEAQTTLTRLREILSKPEWTQNAELRALLHEVERLLSGKPA